VAVSVSGGVARIVLANPEAYNRLDLAAAEGLEVAVHRAAEADVRAVTVTAEGSRFCVGGDLTTFNDTDEAAATLYRSAVRSEAVLRALGDLPKPVVVGVHGAVAGAGLGFILVADLVVASRSTRFVFAYPAVGLTPDCGVSYLLPRVVGERRALTMALGDAGVSADDALAWGLVSELVGDADVARRVDDLAVGLAAGASHAYAETKRLIRCSWVTPREVHAEDEARTITAALRTPDAQRRITEFLAR
jgi:2-(1,2-epoxy-1,2-dihydrophenyl)acetyl-CoA isomerase